MSLEIWRASFGPPASEDVIAEVERTFGKRFPQDYRSFMSTTGGQRFVETASGRGHLAQVIRNIELLSLPHALGEWRSIAEWSIDRSALWWPITVILGSSQHHCLDLDAGSRVIWVADDDEDQRVVAPSFSAFLSMIESAIEGTDYDEEGIELDDDAFDRLLGL